MIARLHHWWLRLCGETLTPVGGDDMQNHRGWDW